MLQFQAIDNILNNAKRSLSKASFEIFFKQIRQW